ncbi:MAG TPA: type I restriction-modification system subunit M N-terminal domain-containing protein, partial [Longimicrobium sp.]|nr:type I restriction-modification system subunit M N-terminal domain-containing protein [Longimicrobium sp.]
MNDLSSAIWSVAERLRGDFRRSDYGKVILPFTVLRRLDCVLEPTRDRVLNALPELESRPPVYVQHVLESAAGQPFFNQSRFSFSNLTHDPNQVAENVMNFIHGFSANVREIMEYFSFAAQVERLDRAGLLYDIVDTFARIDLHPETVDNHQMGTIFEALIRKFAEQSNDTAGDHFTPREVIKLMVNLLFVADSAALRTEGIVGTLYDPACGTGGML